MINFIIWGSLYVVGFFISLFVLHKYGEKLNWANYDPPHGDYYDDYESNAKAYLSFSAAWPIFWAMNSIFGFGRLMVKLSESMGNKIKKNEE